jgi:hypothetical protein
VRQAILGVALGTALALGCVGLTTTASAAPGNLAATWTSVDFDGSNQTLTLRGSGKHAYAMFYVDDFTSGICGGAPAKVVGRAVVDGNDLFTRGTLVCLHGGNPLPGERVFGTLEYHAGTDTLVDSSGVVWHRAT